MTGRISDGSSLTSATVSLSDLLEVVDVSDTSLAATGTNKKMTIGELLAALNVSFTPYGDNVATNVQSALQSVEDRIDATKFIDDLDTAAIVSEHFLGGGLTDGIVGQYGWQLAVGVTGAVGALTTIIDNTCGRTQPTTGTDAGGYAELQLRSGSTASAMMHGSPPFTFEWKVRLAVLPSAAQDFTACCGLFDKSTTADPTSGFGFVCQAFATDATPTWQCIIADPGSAKTTQDSGVAVVAQTDYKLRVTCDGAGTAYFYIDGVLVHTQTSSTNFPDTTVDSYAPTIKIRKTVGTTSRGFQADYFGMRYEYT